VFACKISIQYIAHGLFPLRGVNVSLPMLDFFFFFYSFIARKDGVKNNFKVNENSYWK
jgi:hypothetical protein